MSVLNEALDEARRLERAENAELRRLLWATHPCRDKSVIGGEFRCLECGIDFTNDSITALEAGVQQPSLRWLEAHQNDVCRHCGVTRMTWDMTERLCPNGAGHEWVTPE